MNGDRVRLRLHVDVEVPRSSLHASDGWAQAIEDQRVYALVDQSNPDAAPIYGRVVGAQEAHDTMTEKAEDVPA